MRRVAKIATPSEIVAIFATLAYKPLQSRPARHAVAVLMLLKNKRKPQKAPFAGPAASQLPRVPEQQCTGTSARKSRGRDRAPPLSGAPAEGQLIARAVGGGPVSEIRTSKMPKMKTKSGANKRFKMTGTGKVVAAQAGKRHGMIKRTAKFIQKARGTGVLNDSDAKIVKKYMPYSR